MYKYIDIYIYIIFLELRLAKVEDTASGCVACSLLDIMYPNTGKEIYTYMCI
jgi:hypothetical protein